MASYMYTNVKDDEMLLDGWKDSFMYEPEQVTAGYRHLKTDEMPPRSKRDDDGATTAADNRANLMLHEGDLSDSFTGTANVIKKYKLCNGGSKVPRQKLNISRTMPRLHCWADIVEMFREAIDRGRLIQQPTGSAQLAQLTKSVSQESHHSQGARLATTPTTITPADEEQQEGGTWSDEEESPCAAQARRRRL